MSSGSSAAVTLCLRRGYDDSLRASKWMIIKMKHLNIR